MDRRLLLSRLLFFIFLGLVFSSLKPFLPLQCLIPLGIFLSFILGLPCLFTIAGAVIPLPEEDRFRVQLRVARFLLKRLFSANPACFRVSKGRVEERIPRGRFVRPPLVPAVLEFFEFAGRKGMRGLWSRLRLDRLFDFFYFNKNGLVWVDSDSVAAMQIFIYPSRLLNPSLIFYDLRVEEGELRGDTKPGFPLGFTRMYERIKAPLDLRVQRKKGTVEAVTRDGVKVELDLTLDVALSRPPEGGPPANPYPFDPNRVLRVAYIEAQADEGPIDWVGRAFSIAANALSQVIARYNLRQLYNYPANHTRAAVTPPRLLEEELATLLRGNPQTGEMGLLEDMGITLLELRLSPLRIPVEVLDQTVTEWEASLEMEQAIWEAEADATFWREMEEARAQALQDIAENVFREFANLDAQDFSQEVIVLRLIKALEELASHSLTRQMLSEQTRSRLIQIGILRESGHIEGED